MAAGDASVSVAAGGGWSIADLHWVWWLAVAVFVNSAISLYYYLRIGVIMFFEEAESDRRRPLPRAWFLRLAIWGCALGAFGFGVAGDHLIQLCHSAAESLFSLT
jgi:NADH:ubiquinone oxidoreductase subunit 2 (subunit N)